MIFFLQNLKFLIKKKIILLLFIEMIKEGVIKKGGVGSNIVEKIIFEGEVIKEFYGIIINKREDEIKNISSFLNIQRKRDFQENILKKKMKQLEVFFLMDGKSLVKKMMKMFDLFI